MTVVTRKHARIWLICVAVLAALDLASIVFTKLSLPAGVLTLLIFLGTPKLEPRDKRINRGLFAAAFFGATVGLVRFVVVEAVPSLVAAGNNAAAQSAVSRLREILFVEDVMRERAFVDPDGDGIGSAALLGELSGASPLRGREPMSPPLLNKSYAHVETTAIGPAVVVSGYFFIVCLPRAGGGFSAKPGEAVDEELAERRFVAYAWPAAARRGPQHAYFIDEHDNILIAENRPGQEPRYAGQFFPPPCDAALVEPTKSEFKPWRGKKPRDKLPGER